MLSKLCGPRRLDQQQLHKVQPNTLSRYRDAAAKFSDWLLQEDYIPHNSDAWDDLLVEYKNAWRSSEGKQMSKANFTMTVASVEWFFPRFRGHLTWSHDVIKG